MSVNKIADVSQALAYSKLASAGRGVSARNTASDSSTVMPAGTSTTDVVQSTSLPQMTNMQDVKSKLSEVAGSIRKADTTMGTIGKILAKMEAKLEGFVKNFPPFDSPERADMLRSMTSLRRGIDSLTIPPDDYGATMIMSDPGTSGETGDWNVELGGNGQTITIHRQQVHTGPQGLDVPEFTEDMTKEDIEVVIKKINTAQKTLEMRRSGLAANMVTNGA